MIWIMLGIGLFVGAFIGILIMCLCRTSAEADSCRISIFADRWQEETEIRDQKPDIGKGR